MGRHVRWFAGLVALFMIGSRLAAGGGPPATPAGQATSAPSSAGQSGGAPAASSGVKDLTIIWAQWDPSNYLQQLVKDYKGVAGVDVKVVQEPWGTFGNR